MEMEIGILINSATYLTPSSRSAFTCCLEWSAGNSKGTTDDDTNSNNANNANNAKPSPLAKPRHTPSDP
jgi:hypothetical protein